MLQKIVKILISPLVWLAYAISLRYFLWPVLAGWIGQEEKITWPMAGITLLVAFLATFLTILTLAPSAKKKDDLDEPHVFRREDIKPGEQEADKTIDVIAKRPDVEKM